jgi:hypothetical protein
MLRKEYFAGGHGCLSFVNAVRWQVVSATGRSCVQRGPSECLCVCVCVCVRADY